MYHPPPSLRVLPGFFAILILLMVVCGFAAPPALEQSAPPESATSSIAILALDREEQPVANLQAEALTLRVDKQPTKIISVSSSSQPLTLGIFFDISGSRHQDRHLLQESNAIALFMDAVWRQGDEGFVVAFRDEPFIVVPATGDLKQLRDGVQKLPSLPYAGPTAVWDAVCMPQLKPSSPPKRFLAFLVASDFADNASHVTMDDAEKKMEATGVHLFPVLLLGDDFGYHGKRERKTGKEAAAEVARRTGGDLLEADSYRDFDHLFHRLSNELQSRYIVTFDHTAHEPKAPKIQLSSTQTGIKLFFSPR